jgi:diadenylate cyclase
MVVASTFFIANAFELTALEVISRQILFYLPFAIIVLFQQEIRRALARMGGNPILGFFRRRNGGVPYEPVLEACEVLAAKRIGALIAIEGSQTLRFYEESAKPLDAIVTADLLVAIFTPGGPMHDGAAIVRGSRIVAAGAFLPLTTAADSKLAHGTRHRAALGLSEESDALLIVISEENGSVAAASEGTLHENLDRLMLRQLLVERFGALR